jgi:hypothetical protein
VGQLEQAWALSAENLPATQLGQDKAPLLDALPAPQAKHEPEPVAAWYLRVRVRVRVSRAPWRLGGSGKG